jgi:hypothetical protein
MICVSKAIDIGHRVEVFDQLHQANHGKEPALFPSFQKTIQDLAKSDSKTQAIQVMSFCWIWLYSLPD